MKTCHNPDHKRVWKSKFGFFCTECKTRWAAETKTRNWNPNAKGWLT